MRWPQVIFVALSTALAFSRCSLAAQGRFERTLNVTGPVELSVATGSGSINVRTGDASTVRVYGTIRATAGFIGGYDIEKRIHDIESNPPIEQHGEVIKIGSFEDPDLQRHVSISYDILLPVETRLRAGTGSGNETIDGIRGPLDASTGSGHIRVSNTGGEVRASTGSGGIDLDSVKGGVHASTGSGSVRALRVAGGLRVSTGSGNVMFEQTAPGDVEVQTGSGRVELRNVRGAVRAHTASGTIVAEGDGTGTWRLGTASGGVTVRLPSQAGFELHVRTVSGNITTDRTLTVQGTLSRRELTGKVGNGGFLLDVSTVSGNIHIQ